MIGLIQIPSSSQAVDDKGVYTIFNIHVNGCSHGSFRYSTLLAFHQEIKTKFDTSSLDEFPGKHWFSSLSGDQLFARRIGLERYLHSLCQDRTIGTSDLLKEFLISIQKASSDVSESSGEIEVFLVNGKSVSVTVGSFDRTDQVLERVCSEIQLASELTYYFSLFLEKQSEDAESWTVNRPLTDFECPYITLQNINKLSSTHRVTIRKGFWDPTFLPELICDRVAKNLLYIEALSAVTLGHWDISPDISKRLSALQRKSNKKEYLELVGTLSQYGFMQLDGLTLDHPNDDDMKGFVRVGKLEIVSYSKDDDVPGNKVYTYPLTKIRSWKLGGKPGSPWLKFFLQIGAGDFTPVSVKGSQTILLSYCLHSIVDELLRTRANKDIRQPQTHPIAREVRQLPKLVFYGPAPTTEEEALPDDTDTPNKETASLDNSSSDTTPTSPPEPANTAEPSTPPTKGATGSNSASYKSASNSVVKSAGSSASNSAVKSSTKSSTGADSKKVKVPKKKVVSVSDVENPTFEFGGDEDL